MARISVVGLGNVLMGDDAFGPYVAQLLDGWYEFPEDVQVVELGTQGLDLTPWVRGSEALIVVSSIHHGGAPGELRTLRRDDVMDRELPVREPALRNSPYEPGVRSLMLTLEFTGGAPRDVWVVGPMVESVELIGRLTDPVQEALPRAVDEVLGILRSLGVEPKPRELRRAVKPWWETTR
jgi:hydrogenase maturation protease